MNQLPNNGRNAPRLLQLMQANMAAPRKFEVKAADDGSEATIYLYDLIDEYWGLSATDFIKQLAAITAPTVHLRINSPGGNVFDARAMATAVQGHQSKIIAHVDGVAASAATTVAIAADEVEIADGAFFMIHQAWGMAYGNAGELKEIAALLDKVDVAIAADYARKSGKPVAEIAQLMAAETWFNAQEAVDAGLCDRLCAAGAAKADNAWNFSAYDKAPKALTEKPAADSDRLADRITLLANRAGQERRLQLYERT